MTHLSEPWRVDKSIPIGPIVIFSSRGLVGSTCFTEDAERIVACVNACRHLPTEFLLQHQHGLDAVGLALAHEYVPKRRIKTTSPGLS